MSTTKNIVLRHKNSLDNKGKEIQSLEQHYCSTAKTYSSWNEWSQCSVTCGTGAMARARVCRSTACRKSEMYETKACDRDICPGKAHSNQLTNQSVIQLIN